MSVRKRKWITRSGEEREAWIVDYADQQGERHIETFEKKKDADARHAEVKVDVRAGVHVAPSKSVTVKEAGKSWIKRRRSAGLERATVKQYREHVDQHIVPFIGTVKLSDQRSDRAQIRGPTTRGGAIAGDGPQGYRKPGLAAGRRSGAGAIRAQRRSAIFGAIGVAGKSGTPRSDRRASSRSAWTFPGRTRSRPLSQRQRPLAPAVDHSDLYGLARFRTARAAVEGRRPQERGSSMSGSVPTGSTRSASPSQPRASAWSLSGKFVANTLKEWKLRALRATAISCSPTARAR